MSDASKKDVPRVPLLSPDLKEERLAFLREVVPEAFADGKLDPARLAAALGDAADTGPERYGLSWKGKAECIRLAQRPSSATLLPDREASVDWDTTENLVIEGDNLEVLKLLQRGYAGKVKLIYIDPPYNTGKEFIYSDNYRDPLRQYLLDTGQIAPDSRRTTSEEVGGGRVHSRWLSMMWPRLWLARNLLSETGVLAVSIDDNEVHTLRTVLDELFGEENFVATFAWQKRDTPANDAKGVSVTHEYVVMYRRGEEFARNLLPRGEEQLQNYKNPDADPRGPWTRTSLIRKEHREGRDFPLRNPAGRERRPPPGTSWRGPPEKFAEYAAADRLWWGADGDGDLPFLKRFLSEVKEGVVPISWWDYEFAGSNRNGKMEIRQLFENDVPFETPKPTRLVQRLLEVATSAGTGDLVLDFFAGSGTTGDAVMRLNAEDAGDRRFILVQYPEPTEQLTYPTIADSTRARLRAAKKLLEDKDTGQRSLPGAEAAPSKQDRGFRSFKLAPSNFRIWDSDGAPRDPAALAKQLAMFVDPLVEDRTPEDVVTEILLKSGAGERVVAPLSDRVEERTIAGKKVFVTSFVAGKPLLFICLERPLERELFRGMMEAGAEQIVVLDAGFAGNDGLKANIALELASHDVQLRTI